MRREVTLLPSVLTHCSFLVQTYTTLAINLCAVSYKTNCEIKNKLMLKLLLLCLSDSTRFLINYVSKMMAPMFLTCFSFWLTAVKCTLSWLLFSFPTCIEEGYWEFPKEVCVPFIKMFEP